MFARQSHWEQFFAFQVFFRMRLFHHQICRVLQLRIAERRGLIANQIKKAMKKPHQEQWKARMWGRAKLHNLISVALSSWSGSTSTWYSEYFFHSTWKVGKDKAWVRVTVQSSAGKSIRSIDKDWQLDTKPPVRRVEFDASIRQWQLWPRTTKRSLSTLTGSPLSTSTLGSPAWLVSTSSDMLRRWRPGVWLIESIFIKWNRSQRSINKVFSKHFVPEDENLENWRGMCHPPHTSVGQKAFRQVPQFCIVANVVPARNDA